MTVAAFEVVTEETTAAVQLQWFVAAFHRQHSWRSRRAAKAAPASSSRLVIKRSASSGDDITQRKPGVGRAFRQPAHKPCEPVLPVSDQYNGAEALARQAKLLIALDAVEHLEFVIVFGTPA